MRGRQLVAPVAAMTCVIGLTVASFRLNLATEGPAIPLTRSLAGFAYVIAGQVAWLARPRSRVGPLMLLAGVAWGIIDVNFTSSTDPTHGILFTAATSLKGLFVVLMGHVLLTYPTGRSRSRLDAGLVVALYVVTALLQLGYMLTADTVHIDCPRCPPNVLLLFPSQAVARSIVLTGEFVTIAAAFTILARVLAHWRTETAVGRRALAPILWAIGPIVVVAVVVQVAAAVLPVPHSQPIFAIAPLAYVALPLSLLFGLLRTRLDRGGVSRLVVELGDRSRPIELRDTLAHVLHDPTVKLVYWSGDEGGYVDAEGRAASLPGDDGERAVTLLERGGEPIGAIVHDPRLEDDPELIRAVASAAQLAVHNERLAAELQMQLAETEASRARIVTASDDERRRLERDLHDGAQQRLLTLSLALKMAIKEATRVSDAELTGALAAADEELRLALSELRELAHGIRPPILTQGGLGPALMFLADHAAIPVTITAAPERRFPQPVEAAAYFVVSEALANVAKHARATGATVEVTPRDGKLVIEVADDGVGGADPGSGSGLRGLSDRVAALGGTIEVQSGASGTRLAAELPCV